MAGQKDIKDFTLYSSLSDNDHLLATKTDLGGSDASIEVSNFKKILAQDIKPTIVDDYWYVNGINLGVPAKGKTPVFRKTTDGLEMKYEGEEDLAYQLLIPMVDLIVKFNELTPEQKESIKGENGLSAYEMWEAQEENKGKSYEEYLNFNRQPAMDAAFEADKTMSEISKEADEVIESTRLALDNATEAINKVDTAINNANQTAEAIKQLEGPLINATEDALNAADYAREQGDYAAEEGGKAAQAIPRIEILEESKVDGGFSENGELFLTSNGVVVGDPIPVGSGSGGTGGGGGSTLRLINRGDSTVGVPKGQKVLLQYSFSSLDSETQEPTGNGTAVYFVNNARVFTQSIVQGNIDFDISSYLSDGQNQVRIQVTDSYGAIRSLNIRVEVISLIINSSFDDSLTYSGSISLPYTPLGSGEKTIHFILDNVELEPVKTTTTNRQLYYKLPALSHGSHALKVYATMETSGVEITSNILYFSIMFLATGSTDIIVSSSFSQTEATQYDNLVIPFSVYNPAETITEVQLKANGEVISVQKVDRTQQVWSYRIPSYGPLELEIVAGTFSRIFILVVEKSSIDSEAETEGLELFLTSNGRSNNEENPGTWKYEGIEAQFTGFNFKTNGWILDDNNVSILRISQGAKVEIPFMPFFADFKQSGKAIELEFKVSNVENFTSTVISCFSADRGFKVTPNNIIFKSALSSVSAKFKEDETVRISFVFESRLKNRIIYTYINGIASGAIQYVPEDNFEQTPPVGISLGSPDCTLDVYNIRCYGTDLNQFQVLNNYISDTANVVKKLAVFDRNMVYDSTGEIDYNSLLNYLPCMTIIGELPQRKGDKKKETQIIFENRQNPELSFTASGVENDVQGTSSQYYPRKNYKWKIKNGITLTESGETSDKYALRGTDVPVNAFCMKADFAESSGTHNTGMARYVDQVLKKMNILTPPQKEDYRIRTTIDGYPCAIFHKLTDNAPAIFLGKYNFNNDKGTNETFGFGGADECWEFLNNTADRCLFKDNDFESMGMDEDNNPIPAWLLDFEGRYPDGHNDATNLKVVVSWVKSCINNPSKFKQEVEGHFNLRNLLSYYILTELFGCVDQRAKNMMMASWGNEGSGDYKWYFIFYDNDTVNGINNEGANVFGYDIEDQDVIASGHVWNGWDSELWKLVASAFKTEIAEMYRDMRQQGYISYDSSIYMFNEEQAAKWCEVVYNMDGQYKYIQPLIEYDPNSIEKKPDYLYAMQGSREEHRKWWLSNRFFYLDSKYNAGDFLTDYITMRTYTPENPIGIQPNADFFLTLYKDSYVRVKYGSYIIEGKGKAEETIHVVAPDIKFNDTETIIYGISTIKNIGSLASFYPGTVDISQASTLVELLIGSNVEGYQNKNLTHVSAGNNKMLRIVDIQNCPNYTEPLNISNCENVEVVRALGSSVSMVVLPPAGIVSRLELPETIVNLSLRNQLLLTSENLILSGTGNISTLVLENMISLDQLSLIKELLANTPLKLNRVRLIGIDLHDSDLNIIMELAKLGGVDEAGLNIERAVITGKFYAEKGGETDLKNCREWFPELEIMIGTVVEDPTLTIEFFSKQGQTLTNINFTANVPFIKVNDTTFTIKTARGTTINYTLSADNHISVTDSYEIDITETRRFPVSYIPLRTIIIQQQPTSNPVVGATVKISDTGESFVTDGEGIVYIRRQGAFSISIESLYGEGGFNVPDSSVDDTTTFRIYPYVTLSGAYRKAINYIPLVGTVATISSTDEGNVWEKVVVADEYGRINTQISYGNYIIRPVFNGLALEERTFGIRVEDFDLGLMTGGTREILTKQFMPVKNGNIQFHMAARTQAANTRANIRYKSSTPIRINWGDGNIEQFPGDPLNYLDAYHIYAIGFCSYPIEILDCENVTFFQPDSGQNSYFSAFWTIGNSKAANLSFGASGNGMEYVGADYFKNDITRENFQGVFAGCQYIQEMESGIFDTWVNATNISYAFQQFTWQNKPRIDLSVATKVTNVYGICQAAIMDRLPIIKSKNIFSIQVMAQNAVLLEVRRDDIPVDLSTLPTNIGAFQGIQKVKVFEFLDCVTNIQANFCATGALSFEQGVIFEIFQTIPPPAASNGIPGLSQLVNSNTYIYVPDESLDAYKAATTWNSRAERIKPASEKP